MAAKIAINEKKSVATVMKLLSIEGLSGAERPVAEEVRRMLRSAGVSARAMRFDGAAGRMKRPEMKCDNLVVQIPGDRRPRRLFNAHMDTVTLARGCRPVRKGSRVVSGSGTALGADDRSGVACIISAVRTVLERKLPHPPLTLVFTVGEEIGLLGARYVDRKVIRGIKHAYNFDGSGPEMLNMGAPSANDFEIEVIGLASHAGGAPERGASAVAAASVAIADMKRRGWFGKVKKGKKTGTSNIGDFVAEGPTNIVSPVATLTGEARSHSDAFLKRISFEYRKAFERACRATRSVEGKRCNLKFKTTPCYKTFLLRRSQPVVAHAIEAAKAAGLKPKLVVGGGGLDANYYCGYGMPTLTMGAGGHDAHTVTESLDLGEHLAACRLAVALMTV